jgi:hypothetical protein
MGRSWLTILDAAPWLSAPDISNNKVHPSDSGHGLIAARYFSALNNSSQNSSTFNAAVPLNAGLTQANSNCSYWLMHASQGYNLPSYTIMVWCS